MVILVRKIDSPTLIERAIEEHQKYGGEQTLETCTEQDLNHILLNYIRHKLVSVDNQVPPLTRVQYFIDYCRVNKAIAQHYPFLAETARESNERKELAIRLENLGEQGWEEL